MIPGLCIYNIFFHPFAKYPGPFLAKICNQRAAYYAWTGDLHIDMWRCHERYGPYVRYAPNRLIVNSAGGMRDIYGFGKNFGKARQYALMTHRAPSTFTLLDKKEHLRRRKLLSQGFSDAAIRSFEPKILYHVGKFCDLMEGKDEAEVKENESQQWSAPWDMSVWCDYLFFDLISDIVFGHTYNLLGNPEHRYITHAIDTSNVRISVFVQDWILGIFRMDKKLFPAAVVARNQFLNFMRSLVARSRKAEHDGDVFGMMLDAKDPGTGQGLTPDETAAEATTLLVAGSDTSSTLMASLFFYMGRNPSIYNNVVAEVRGKFNSSEELKMGPKLNSCRYLRAVIDECLRMSPPVGAAPFRESLKGGATVEGHYIPEGMLLGTSIYSTHHSKEYFENPLQFCPERWMEKDSPSAPAVSELGHSMYTPFSLGPRNCIGKSLAVNEAAVAIAIVCLRFDFRVVDINTTNRGGGRLGAVKGRDRPEEFQLEDHITSAKKGPLVQFRRR